MSQENSLMIPDALNVEGAFASASADVSAVGPSAWEIRFGQSPSVLLHARRVGDVLVLWGATRRRHSVSPWALLKANSDLPGMVKFALSPEGQQHLRAELLLQDGGSLQRRLRETVQGFDRGMMLAQGRRMEDTPAGLPAEPTSLEALCEATGWPFSALGAEQCAVPLDSRRATGTATVSRTNGLVRVCANLACWSSLPAICADAMASLLLRANFHLRVGRAVVAEDEDGGAAELEVVFAPPVAPVELRGALEALSVGIELCAETAECMLHESAAQTFLALRGGSRSREKHEEPSKTEAK